jgi:hypothetical protein
MEQQGEKSCIQSGLMLSLFLHVFSFYFVFKRCVYYLCFNIYNFLNGYILTINNKFYHHKLARKTKPLVV